MTAARQLSLDLPARPALGRGDFYVAPANAVAVAQIDAWRAWPARKLALVGPPGSGKTHLAQVWRTESGGNLVAAEDLAEADIPGLATGPVCVEDADRLAGARRAEDALFHLHNLVLAEGHSLLLTGALPPARWPLALPDLASRLHSTPVAKLAPPDDTLLSAVLAKLFADRQIVPDPGVIPYLVRRMPRAFADAQRLVAEIDRTALARRRRVTLAIAREAFAESDPEEGA
ncbi:P-loop NTPase family protein [Roseivivax sp. CAU 1761]